MPNTTTTATHPYDIASQRLNRIIAEENAKLAAETGAETGEDDFGIDVTADDDSDDIDAVDPIASDDDDDSDDDETEEEENDDWKDAVSRGWDDGLFGDGEDLSDY